jgi:hypothetical protein
MSTGLDHSLHDRSSSSPEQQIQRAVFAHLTPAQCDAHAALAAAGARLEAWGLVRGSCQGRRP